MTKWTAEKDAFSNGLIDTGITVFHVCDLTSEEETLRLLTDIAERHNADIDAITAERDRLAAENARLEALVGTKNESIEVLYAKWSKEIVKAEAANATLDRLREVLAKWMAFDAFNAYDAIGEIRAILYPPETTNDDQI